MTAILGINSFSHDTAACLVVDGVPVAMAEEERFNRECHTKAFPDRSIEHCLSEASIAINDLDVVAFACRPDLDLARGLRDAVGRMAPKRACAQCYIDVAAMARMRAFLRRFGYRGRVERVGHHDAHAAAAFFASPFEAAAVATMDRGGDYLSATLRSGLGCRLRTLGVMCNPQSLGELYSAVTWFLGFAPNADEGKVMGLASYGTDRFVDAMRELVHLAADGRIEIDLSYFDFPRDGAPVSPRFVERFGAPRSPESEITERDRDLARAVQVVTEEAALHLLGRLLRRTTFRTLCLGGGLALNSVMNERIAAVAGFDDLFVQPVSSDAGNSLGAALWVWHQRYGRPRRWAMEHAYLGPDLSADLGPALERAVRTSGLRGAVSVRQTDDPASQAARLVADGLVVGWFQGRAEVGARALGNRSILADPRRAEMRDIVNARVKRREWFRPFAPAVLHERGRDYFVDYLESPYMALVETVRPERRVEIPAVTHVDGTARLQSVRRETNPAFFHLLSEFDRLTGVPIILNTSFNVRGEPMVNRPEEAVADLARTKLDALVIGDRVIEKLGSKVAFAG